MDSFPQKLNFLFILQKKKTTVEILEGLDKVSCIIIVWIDFIFSNIDIKKKLFFCLIKQIKECESFKLKSQTNERKFVGALMLYFLLLYFLGAIIYYLYLMPNNLVGRIKSLMPFFITPIMYVHDFILI
jgi:hypothetical protein